MPDHDTVTSHDIFFRPTPHRLLTIHARNRIIDALAKRYQLNPYGDWEPDPSFKFAILPKRHRVYFGPLHAARIASYIPRFIELYESMGVLDQAVEHQFTPRYGVDSFLHSLQIASYFIDVSRRSDGSSPDYASDANLLEAFFEEEMRYEACDAHYLGNLVRALGKAGSFTPWLEILKDAVYLSKLSRHSIALDEFFVYQRLKTLPNFALQQALETKLLTLVLDARQQMICHQELFAPTTVLLPPDYPVSIAPLPSYDGQTHRFCAYGNLFEIAESALDNEDEGLISEIENPQHAPAFRASLLNLQAALRSSRLRLSERLGTQSQLAQLNQVEDAVLWFASAYRAGTDHERAKALLALTQHCHRPRRARLGKTVEQALLGLAIVASVGLIVGIAGVIGALAGCWLGPGALVSAAASMTLTMKVLGGVAGLAGGLGLGAGLGNLPPMKWVGKRVFQKGLFCDRPSLELIEALEQCRQSATPSPDYAVN